MSRSLCGVPRPKAPLATRTGKTALLCLLSVECLYTRRPIHIMGFGSPLKVVTRSPIRSSSIFRTPAGVSKRVPRKKQAAPPPPSSQRPGIPPLHACASRAPNCESAAPANRPPTARRFRRVRRELPKVSNRLSPHERRGPSNPRQREKVDSPKFASNHRKPPV